MYYDLSVGPSTIGYITDSGEDITSHQYKTIIRWCPGLDGVSFAYITTNNNDSKTYCHAFQCLDLNEVIIIRNLEGDIWHNKPTIIHMHGHKFAKLKPAKILLLQNYYIYVFIYLFRLRL